LYALGDYENALRDFYASIANRENLLSEVRKNPRYIHASSDSVNLYLRGFTSASLLCIAECQFGSGAYDLALKEINRSMDNLPQMKEIKKENYYNV